MSFSSVIPRLAILDIILWIIYGVLYYGASYYLKEENWENVLDKFKFLGFLYFLNFGLSSITIMLIIFKILSWIIKLIFKLN